MPHGFNRHFTGGVKIAIVLQTLKMSCRGVLSMRWADKCMLELTHRNLFEDDGHRSRFKDLLDCYFAAPFFTKGLCKCMYLGAWDNVHFAMLLDILNEMTIERADHLEPMVDNGIVLEKSAEDVGDDAEAAILNLSLCFTTDTEFDRSCLDTLEVTDPESAYIIKRALLAAQCIDDLPRL